MEQITFDLLCAAVSFTDYNVSIILVLQKIYFVQFYSSSRSRIRMGVNKLIDINKQL